jgi:hypothetical protein
MALGRAVGLRWETGAGAAVVNAIPSQSVASSQLVGSQRPVWQR